MAHHIFRELGRLTADAMPDWESAEDPATLQVKDKLIALNRMGVVTWGSQIGFIKEGDFAFGTVDHEREGYTWMKQRAYLSLMTDGKSARKIVDLMTTTELIVDLSWRSAERDHNVPCTVFSRPETPDVWDTCTWVGGMPSFDDVWDSMMVTKDDLYEPAMRFGVLIEILDPVWGRKEFLFDQVLKAVSRV
jgi:hypothetical protein